MQLNKDEFTRVFELSEAELNQLINKKVLVISDDNDLDLYDKKNYKWICENKIDLLFFARIHEVGI